MSHSTRQAKVGALVTAAGKPKVRKAQSPMSQQVLAQSRGILGLIGLGMLSTDPYQLTSLELELKAFLTSTQAAYLVLDSQVPQAIALAGQDVEKVRVDKTRFTTVKVAGANHRVYPMYLETTA